jgi:hypothetical protein
MQVQQHWCVRTVMGQPQAVQPFGLAAVARLKVDPYVRHVVGGLRAAPAAVAGLKDPFALLGIQRGAARRDSNGQRQGCEERSAFHG